MPINSILSIQRTPVEPIVEPLSLADFKLYAKVDYTEDDALIETTLIPAAREMIEEFLGISLIPTNIETVLNNGCGNQELPYGPVNGTIPDADVINIEGEAFSPSLIAILGVPFPSMRGPVSCYVSLSYNAGYVSTPAAITAGGYPIPQAFVNAIAAQAFFLYENRGARGGYQSGVRDYQESYVCDAAIQLCSRFRRNFDII
jgi:hypothetical protein